MTKSGSMPMLCGMDGPANEAGLAHVGNTGDEDTTPSLLKVLGSSPTGSREWSSSGEPRKVHDAETMCRCSELVLMWLAVMVTGCLSYIWVADVDSDGDLNDKAGGWATDFALALAAMLFAASSRLVAEDRFFVFYLGTAIAYGLGGAAHFLEDCTGAGLVAYYVLMTLAFGGDALRSAFGYALPRTRPVLVQRGFTFVVFCALCLSAAGSLELLLSAVPSALVRASPVGRAYQCAQIGMAFVEVTGSLVWLWESPGRGLLPIMGASINIASWIVVKFLPPLFASRGITSTVAHSWSHYMQFAVIWVLQSISLQDALAKKGSPPSEPLCQRL